MNSGKATMQMILNKKKNEDTTHALLRYVQLQLSEPLTRDALHKQDTFLPHITSLQADWHGLGLTDFRAMSQHP